MATSALVGTKPAPPTDDRRWRMVDTRIRRGGGRPDALIEVLHEVQELFGFIDREAMAYVGAALRVPPSRVYGVVTFYSHFMLEPAGVHTCVVCTGTACYINGSSAIVERVRAVTGAGPGETTDDGKLSVVSAHCIGACSMAPAVVVDGEIKGKMTPAVVAQLLEAL